jgi:hypothetical protein
MENKGWGIMDYALANPWGKMEIFHFFFQVHFDGKL